MNDQNKTSLVVPTPRCEVCGGRECDHAVCGICMTTQSDLGAHWDAGCTPVD